MRELVANQAAFDKGRLLALVLDNVQNGRTLLDQLASLALLYRPQLLLFLFTGHGSAPSPGNPSALCFWQGPDATVGAVQLAPLLCACGAQTTLVLLDCCYSTGILRNFGFPGLVVVPACGDDQEVVGGFTSKILVPMLGGTCATPACPECVSFCAATNVRVFSLLEHLPFHLPVRQ